jgi:hypothetical protein
VSFLLWDISYFVIDEDDNRILTDIRVDPFVYNSDTSMGTESTVSRHNWDALLAVNADYVSHNNILSNDI